MAVNFCGVCFITLAGASGKIQTPDLRIMFRLFYHCAMQEKPVLQYFENNPAYSIVHAEILFPHD